MPHCTKCKTSLAIDDQFCPECGIKVSHEQVHKKKSSKVNRTLEKKEHIQVKNEITNFSRSGKSIHIRKILEISVFCLTFIIVGTIFLIAGHVLWATGLAFLGALFLCTYLQSKYVAQHPDKINPIPLRERGNVVETEDQNLVTKKILKSSPAAAGLREGVIEEQMEKDNAESQTKDTAVIPLLVALVPILLLIIFVIAVWPLKLWAGIFSTLVILFTGNFSLLMVRDILGREEGLSKVDKGKDITIPSLISLGVLVLFTIMVPVFGILSSGKGHFAKVFFMLYLFLIITFTGIVGTMFFMTMLTNRSLRKHSKRSAGVVTA